MSQEKVDQHKKAKANRKQAMRREKAERAVAWTIVMILLAAICIWIGYSVYNKATGQTAADNSNPAVTVNTDAVDDYLDDLNTNE